VVDRVAASGEGRAVGGFAPARRNERRQTGGGHRDRLGEEQVAAAGVGHVGDGQGRGRPAWAPGGGTAGGAQSSQPSPLWTWPCSSSSGVASRTAVTSTAKLRVRPASSWLPETFTTSASTTCTV